MRNKRAKQLRKWSGMIAKGEKRKDLYKRMKRGRMTEAEYDNLMLAIASQARGMGR